MIRLVTFAMLLVLALGVPPARADEPGTTPPLRTAAFRVTGMTCALCAHAIEKAVRGVDGVRDVAVDRAAERVVVVADPAVDDDALERAIEGAGRYRAEPER